MVLQGSFHPDFGRVAETLIKMLPQRKNPSHAGGASLCVYHKGVKVVDIWGGTKDRDGNPWQEDTVVFSASTTKGVTSTLMHILVDQGLADYDDPIAKYWPEFGQNGKDKITIRQAMNHQAGLYNIADYDIREEDLNDWHSICTALETAAPAHEPGLHSAYHGLTYGHLVGSIIEKITQQPFQQVLLEKLADPLELDGLFIGVPDNAINRLAKLISLDGRLGLALRRHHTVHPAIRKILHFFSSLLGADFTHFARALGPDCIHNVNVNDKEHMQAVIPSVNGAFTARSLAKMYAAIANGGEIEGHRLLSENTVQRLMRPQVRGRDKVLVIPMGWRLGYHSIIAVGAKTPRAFGHFGFGGSGAWCDPSRNLAMAMTLNTGVGTPTGDLRIAKMSGDVIRCAERREKWPAASPEGIQVPV